MRTRGTEIYTFDDFRPWLGVGAQSHTIA